MTSTAATPDRYGFTGAIVRKGLNHIDWDAAELGLPATMERPCPLCSGPTIPADPTRPEEVGFYCEQCARACNADGELLAL